MLIFLKRQIRYDTLDNPVFMVMSAPITNTAMINIRSLDPTSVFGIRRMQHMMATMPDYQFDMWYKDYIEQNPNNMVLVASILKALFANNNVVIYVGSQPYDDVVTESIAKYFLERFGIKAMYIDNVFADVDEELEDVDFDMFDDFSDEGLALAKQVVDTYIPNQGVQCSIGEVEFYGLWD